MERRPESSQSPPLAPIIPDEPTLFYRPRRSRSCPWPTVFDQFQAAPPQRSQRSSASLAEERSIAGCSLRDPVVSDSVPSDERSRRPGGFDLQAPGKDLLEVRA